MIFAITGEQFNLGSVFLIWSIHHLTSQKKYYLQKNKSIEEIPSNPLLNGTAHRMSPNHSKSIKTCEDIIKLLRFNENLNHLKYTPLANSIEEYHEYNKKFHASMIKHNVKVINISCQGLQHLIGFLRFHREVVDWQKDMDTVKEHCRHYWPHFFDNTEIYNDKLDSWHDVREGIAFNVRPYDFWKSFTGRNTHENIYHCRFEDLLLDGKGTFVKILDFLELNYNKELFNDWCQIHDKWSSNLKNYVYFCNDIEKIVENIISNKPMDLTKYRMDVLKEGVLLHFLMFKHDLNLNTPVEKLPTDSQKIFKLLEKNQRTGIANLYDK